ncbi:MAG: HAD family hydrolase [Candidatus Scatosoma sp.]
MIKLVLFDLDGTLLPMDQDVFIKAYFGELAKKLALRGYQAKDLISAVLSGTAAMVNNDGTKTNEAVFWDKFTEIYGEQARADEPYFEEFYRRDFDNLQSCCGYNPKAKEIVERLKSAGLRVALATNPVFPAAATEKRMGWAGFSPDDFEWYTTYENSRYCKPAIEYYRDIANRSGVRAEECLMVGNDVSEDMAAEKIGMKVFLLTDCLINRDNRDVSVYPNGDFDVLLRFIEKNR